ncbi:odorant receptor Or1-like [Belonocnema kinseyi]|uniref:odorant receptor Or1-like n=1 Tax=Belonocnema kinseyi TaxID=2817044 RepID=UPI00143D3E3D|nr:odorant receptor Or1-like [Belonocnema kinseyi]
MDLSKSETTVRKVEPNLHLKVSLGIIRYMGTWPPQNEKVYRFVYMIYTVTFLAFMLGIYLFVQSINVVLSWGNLSKIASGAPIFMTNAVHAYKFIIIVRYQKRIQELLNTVHGPMFNQHNLRHERIVSWYAWQGIFHHAAYQSFGTFAVICWGCIPIAAFLDGNNNRLPLDGWYPYDATKSPAFEITWSHQSVAIILGCIHNVAMDAFITGLMNVASCQFELLKWNIVAIGNDQNQDSKFTKKLSKSNNYFLQMNYDDQSYAELRKCIQHNLAIFEFVAEIQDLFSTVISMQLFVNCLIICFTTFYISQLTEYLPAELAGNISYTCCMTYQIYIYCWNGNELYLQNQSFAQAIYMGKWWKQSERYKRSLHIVMLRTCRPLILTAGYFMTLSVSTFMAIIKMSYSMFTLLRSSTENI